jgi:hypothetical protein
MQELRTQKARALQARERATKPEDYDVLQFRATHQPATVESLLAWARRTYPRGLDDPALLKNIYYSNEFSGSADARERAAIALVLRLSDEQKHADRGR